MPQKSRIPTAIGKFKVLEKFKLGTISDNEKLLQKLKHLKAAINKKNDVDAHNNAENTPLDRKEMMRSVKLVQRFILCGVNAVQKSIEKRKSAIVFISGEKMPTLSCNSNPELLSSIYPLHVHIIESCQLNHIPVILLPKSNEYKEYFNVKKLSCLSIPNVDCINSIINDLNYYDKDEVDTIHASFDGLKEFVK